MAATAAPAATAQTTAGHGYRPDIDGLRAVSILLVVAFHAGWSRFAGGYVGVDVFFVISGYLVTGILVRSALTDGGISLRDFYARRIRRLLPLSVLVSSVTVAVAWFLVPPLARVRLLYDAVAAGLYVANWRFAGQATAYSDHEVTDGLLLHYWSLSIEEQFYLLWPLLVVVVAVLVRRRWPERFLPALAGTLSLVVLASLAASVLLTERVGPQAYYLTHTRLWEMGLGGLLALLLPRLPRLGARVAGAVGVAGLLAIGWAAVTYDATTAFPGWAASVPALGAAAVIAAGSQGGATSVSRGLSRWPLPGLGRRSYAWYLWHWPVLGLTRLAIERFELDVAPVVATAGAVAASLVLAAVTHVGFEEPLRHATWLRTVPRRSFALGVCATVLPLLAFLGLLRFGDTGGRELPLELADAGESVTVMSPAEASEDRVDLEPGCHLNQHETVLVPCVYGDPDGERTVAIIGDSHAEHWLPALDAAGRDRGWRVLPLTKSSCAPIDVPIWNDNFERRYTECERWREEVYAHLEDQPEVATVVLSRSRNYRSLALDGADRRGLTDEEFHRLWTTGATRTFERLRAAADEVVVLRDTPWALEDVPECLSARTPDACALTVSEHGVGDEPLARAERAGATDGVRFLDPRPLICDGDACPVVTGDGVIKFRDRHHLTQTYARQLAPAFARLLTGEAA